MRFLKQNSIIFGRQSAYANDPKHTQTFVLYMVHGKKMKSFMPVHICESGYQHVILFLQKNEVWSYFGTNL